MQSISTNCVTVTVKYRSLLARRATISVAILVIARIGYYTALINYSVTRTARAPSSMQITAARMFQHPDNIIAMLLPAEYFIRREQIGHKFVVGNISLVELYFFNVVTFILDLDDFRRTCIRHFFHDMQYFQRVLSASRSVRNNNVIL